MSFVQIDWSPDEKAMRGFGRTLFIGFAIISAVLWWWKGWTAHFPWMLGVPAAIWALTFVSTKAARPFYLVWMGIALVMGTIISTILMAVIYWGLFGFISLCFRLRGRDRLHLKSPTDGTSLWVTREAPPPAERYQRQF
ncbi:MAG: hypothetical protein AAGF12_36680 [Myxococcota bacterium]